MRQFNYIRAWRELAAPQFNGLAVGILGLVARVQEECRDLHQGPDLETIWPASNLRICFEAVDDETLAHAARVVYFLGHWAPGRTRQLALAEANDRKLIDRANELQGANWKFSNYADQVLRARLGLAREMVKQGIGFAVHEGVLRVCWSTRDSWQWQEIGWATAAVFAKAQAVKKPTLAANDYTTWETYVIALKAACGSDSFKPWAESDRFMEEEPAR